MIRKILLNRNCFISLIYVFLSAFIKNDFLTYFYFAFLFSAEVYDLLKGRYENIVCQILLLIPLMGLTAVDKISLANIYTVVFSVFMLCFNRGYGHSKRVLLCYCAFVAVDFVRFLVFSQTVGLTEIMGAVFFYLSIYASVVAYEIIMKNKNRALFSSSFVFGTLLSILYGFIVRFLEGGIAFAMINTNILTRNAGASGDPNYFGLYIGISISLLLAWVVLKKTRVLGCSLLMLFLGFMGMSSSSRMYYVILAFIAFVAFVYLIRQLFSKDRLKALMVLLLLFVSGFALKDSIMPNIDYILYRTTNESDVTNGRLDLVDRYVSYMDTNDIKPVTGIGIPRYNYRSGIVLSSGSAPYAHNLYIELYVTQGGLGVVILFTVVLIVLFRSRDRIGFVGLLPAMVFLICGLGINIIEVDSFYVLFALIICFANKEAL